SAGARDRCVIRLSTEFARFPTGGETMRHLLTAALLVTVGLGAALAGDDKPKDTPKAAKTRKLLKTKVSVEFKNTRLEEAVDEIKEQVKGLSIRLDTAGGVSRNLSINYTGKDKTVEEVLDGMFQKNGLGYVVISDPKHTYNGSVLIKQGK